MTSVEERVLWPNVLPAEAWGCCLMLLQCICGCLAECIVLSACFPCVIIALHVLRGDAVGSLGKRRDLGLLVTVAVAFGFWSMAVLFSWCGGQSVGEVPGF